MNSSHGTAPLMSAAAIAAATASATATALYDGAGHAPRPATPIRSNALAGLQCLRCDAVYPLRLVHEGCPACKAQGIYVSLRARYTDPPIASDAARNGGLNHALQPMAERLPNRVPYSQPFTLGEGNTPLLQSPALSDWARVDHLRIKDESRNPTGSHKDRMSALGISQALDFGAHTVVLASSGNAAVSAAHYAHAAGLACEVAVYEGMPQAYVERLDAAGAKRFAFASNEARWAFVSGRAQRPGYLALTNHHLPALGSAPLAIEGYKAIAHETLAQGGLPEHVVVPTARGDLAWGIYAGFRDLLDAGRITQLPKIWVVEPFARLSCVLEGAGLHGSYAGQTAQFSTAGATVTYLQWQAVTASGGGALVVADDAARIARLQMAQVGISAELCAAAGLAAVRQLRDSNSIARDSKVLLMLTANASCDPSWPDTV
jgi:threonine synthase